MLRFLLWLLRWIRQYQAQIKALLGEIQVPQKPVEQEPKPKRRIRIRRRRVQ